LAVDRIDGRERGREEIDETVEVRVVTDRDDIDTGGRVADVTGDAEASGEAGDGGSDPFPLDAARQEDAARGNGRLSGHAR
jgi:hypothetical protein